MATDEEMFNSQTKGETEDEIFNSQTKDQPHRITLCYSLDLPSTMVQRFPSQAIRKHTGDRVWFARHPNADVCLFDKDFPRNCMELKCVTDENGEMIVTVKNLDDKKLVELKAPGRDNISLRKNQESRIETQTLLSISLMPLIVVFQNGDVNASNYEVIMNGLIPQSFNTMMLSTSGNTTSVRRTSGPPPIPVLQYQPNGLASSFGCPPLPACPDLSSSWQTSSFTSQTKPKQLYTTDPTQFSRNPHNSNLSQVYPTNGFQYDANIRPSAQPCSCGFGIRQGNPITNPESCGCSSQGFIDIHQREYDRQASCPVCNPSITPFVQQGVHYVQANHHGFHQPLQRCTSDTQRMSSTPTNWHNHTSPGGLPTAPPVRDNYVNTHPYTENTPHDFNVNILDMYKQ